MARNRTITNPANDSSLVSSVVRNELQILENEIIQGAGLLGKFMGDGNQGAVTVSSNTNLSTIDDANFAGLIQCTSFNLTGGNTLTVDTGWLWLLCTGTVTIAGTIDADGQGESGGTGGSGSGNPGNHGHSAANMGTTVNTGDERSPVMSAPVPFCLSGAGGGGGADVGQGAGGSGGGAGGSGGAGGTITSTSTDDGLDAADATTKALFITGKGTLTGTTAGLSPLIALSAFFRGAGGGGGGASGGSAGGNGGAGGGCIYIECNELVFTGTLTADGADGGTGIFGAASGGGGGGGTILVRAKTITTNTGSMTVTGGNGDVAESYNGGDGANGFKNIMTVLD